MKNKLKSNNNNKIGRRIHKTNAIITERNSTTQKIIS